MLVFDTLSLQEKNEIFLKEFFFIKLYRSLGVCVLNLGSVSSLGPEIKNQSRRRYLIPYLKSPNGDMED